MSDETWNHAGISRIEDGESRTVKVPEMVRERGILTPGLPVFWSYETVVGIVVVSDSELKKDEYETVEFTKLQDGDNSFENTVPAKFFDDFQGRGDRSLSEPVYEKARFEPEERVHFMFRDEMAESDPNSCYVLTDQKFIKRFEKSDKWQGTLDDVPRFL